MNKLSIALADSIIARYPDPRDIPYRSWCYVHGYILTGFEKLYEAVKDPRYLDYILRYADAQVGPSGELPAFTGVSLDDIMAGTAIIIAWQRTGEERYRLAADRIRRCFDDYPRNADGGFWHTRYPPHEMWIDGAFMGQMFLIRYGDAIGDRNYCFGEAVRQLEIMARRLSKEGTGLYLHGYDESRAASWADKETGLSPEVWSEGLGWFALILAETLFLIDRDHQGRPGVERLFRSLVEGLARVQDTGTGLWYQVVDKESEKRDNWHDSSGSAMFIYAIQRAVDLGCVDGDHFGPVAEKGYAGLLTKVRLNADGLVDIRDACDGVCVQDNYEAYINVPRVVNAKEAMGGLLWAATIMEN